jgi:DnaK suppressor protein
MTATELNRFKETLENRQAELERIVRNRDGIVIEKSADELDEVQYAAERDLAIRNLDRESALLRNVRSALRRIKDGSFGICVNCEEEISPKRLTAVPSAPLCIHCQEQADRNHHDGDETFHKTLVNAA